MSELLLRAGEWETVDPASASWRYLSFNVDRIGDLVQRETGDNEVALVVDRKSVV